MPAEALEHRARARSVDARVVRTFVSACTRCRVSCHEQQAGLSEKARMTYFVTLRWCGDRDNGSQ